MARSLRPLEVFPITTRTLDVLRVVDVTPGMRRVTLGGPELTAFTAPNGYPVADFRSDGFDDEFKILLKHPDVDEAIGPAQNDGILDWPRDPLMVLRTYTARRWDPVSGELDVDFVQHGVGPATAWSRKVTPGERIQIAGPKMSSGQPEGADWCLIAGDETAPPAIGRWLEEFPVGARAQVFVEVGEESHRQALTVPEGVELTWLVRHGAKPGSTTLLLDALQAAPWWEGTVFAWVSGEAVTLTPIRRWLRQDKGLPKEQVEVTGYWRRTEVIVSDEDPEQPDLEATENEAHAVHELTEIVPGFALRTAVTIGLPTALAPGPLDTAALARSTGTSRVGLGKLLRYLGALGIVEQTEDGRWAPTRGGRVLEEEHVEARLDLTGTAARRELGVLALAGAVRTGRTEYAAWFGGGYEELTQRDPAALTARVQSQADDAAYVAGALAAHAVFGNLTDLVVTGSGAREMARALVGNHAALRTVGADGFVAGLAEGLGTPVGAGGHALTPAQAQHLALARLVLADPALAVLDEATADADTADAQRLDTAAAAALEGRAALVVAHRLSQAREADGILVMEDGQVRESGTHDELLASGGRYATLWRAWSAGRPG